MIFSMCKYPLYNLKLKVSFPKITPYNIIMTLTYWNMIGLLPGCICRQANWIQSDFFHKTWMMLIGCYFRFLSIYLSYLEFNHVTLWIGWRLVKTTNIYSYIKGVIIRGWQLEFMSQQNPKEGTSGIEFHFQLEMSHLNMTFIEGEVWNSSGIAQCKIQVKSLFTVVM